MKKIPLILILAVMFTGCAEKNNIPDSANSIFPEITEKTESATTKPERPVSKSGFNITSEGIEVIQRGEISQVLEDTNIWISFKYCGYFPDAGDILIRKDYDNDGYKDLCIPYINSDKLPYTNSGKCVYYHLDPDTAQYEKWNSFNELNGVIEKYYINNSDYKSSYILKRGDNQNTIYKCNGLQLKYAGKEITFAGDDNFTYIDTYFLFDNTNKEQLIERKKIKDGKVEEIFVHPSQCYFTVYENCIDIWWKYGNNYKTIQTIEGNYQSENEPQHSHCSPHKQNVIFKDIDGDGYDDIYVKEGENSGKYFRFNPETFKFDEV